MCSFRTWCLLLSSVYFKCSSVKLVSMKLSLEEEKYNGRQSKE